MREIRLFGSEGGEEFKPLSLPLSARRHLTRSRCPCRNESPCLPRGPVEYAGTAMEYGKESGLCGVLVDAMGS